MHQHPATSQMGLRLSKRKKTCTCREKKKRDFESGIKGEVTNNDNNNNQKKKRREISS
jgi:hypothetical protein